MLAVVECLQGGDNRLASSAPPIYSAICPPLTNWRHCYCYVQLNCTTFVNSDSSSFCYLAPVDLACSPSQCHSNFAIVDWNCSKITTESSSSNLCNSTQISQPTRIMLLNINYATHPSQHSRPKMSFFLILTKYKNVHNLMDFNLRSTLSTVSWRDNSCYGLL